MRRLLAVHAHPDDESSKGAATYAKYVALGYQMLIVSCTGGELGDVLNSAVAAEPLAQRDLAALRRREMRAAQHVCGFTHRWLGYRDSGMPENPADISELSFAGIPVEIAAAPLVRIVREFRPHVMVTYNEMGGYPHPDHIQCHRISKHAWDVAGDPAAYPEAGEPWEIKKLYYDAIFNSDRFAALLAGAEAADPESADSIQLRAIVARMRGRGADYTTQVEVADYLEQRDHALLAHTSQVSPADSFFFISNELQRAHWPYEDFRLADSRLPEAVPEEDLFSGIPEAGD